MSTNLASGVRVAVATLPLARGSVPFTKQLNLARVSMATDIHPSPENPRISTLKLGEGGNRVRLRTCPIVLLKKLEGLSIRFVAAKHTDLHLGKIAITVRTSS